MADREESRRSWRDWLNGIFADGSGEIDSEMERLIRVAVARKEIDSDTVDIIKGALRLSDQTTRHCMIPRDRMHYIQEDMPYDDILKAVIATQHSRYPVIGDDLDEIKGILHTKELLLRLRDNHTNGQFDLKEVMREATVVPEYKRLIDVLKDFQENRTHMAIVVDEFSHVSGLITIEDVLEEIVGDIEDEHDQFSEPKLITELSNESYEINASTTIEEFNEYFETTLERGQIDNIGGLVTHELGHVPVADDVVEIEGFRFVVCEATPQRVLQLVVRKT